MENEQVVNNTLTEEQKVVGEEKVNDTLLKAIKTFMDDLSNVTTDKNFSGYHTIVKHIDSTKVKAYNKLIDGFINFFDNNVEQLTIGDFENLNEPTISYATDNGSFFFNFQQIFEETEECDQDIIKDHLNHIWSILKQGNKSPEEIYIDKIFNDLKTKFSPDLTREEQMMIAKDLFNDFQTQDLNISVVVKVACKRARETLISNGTDDQSKTLVLIDAVEEIDINNFDMVQFIGLVGKVGNLFSDGDNNPLSSLLSGVLVERIPIEHLSLEDAEKANDNQD